MNELVVNEHLIKAQGEIAKILRDLEIETNCIVSYVQIESIDCSTFANKDGDIRRQIEIGLEPRPGAGWLI